MSVGVSQGRASATRGMTRDIERNSTAESKPKAWSGISGGGMDDWTEEGKFESR